MSVLTLACGPPGVHAEATRGLRTVTPVSLSDVVVCELVLEVSASGDLSPSWQL